MSKLSIQARQGYSEIVENIPTIVPIPGTKRTVALTGVQPYTLERLTLLWLERDVNTPKDSADTLKSMCQEPFFAVKEACIFTLNNVWGLRFIYPFKWRIWAYLRGYTEKQMLPIIIEGKKKLPLTEHWLIMAYSADMRTDLQKMTAKEAEQYRAELLLEQSQLSSKNTLVTGGLVSE